MNKTTSTAPRPKLRQTDRGVHAGCIYTTREGSTELRVLNCTAYNTTSILLYSSTKYWTDSLRKSMCRMMVSIRVQENALEGRKQCVFFFPPPMALVILCVPSTSPYNHTIKSDTISKGKLHIQSWPGRFRRTPRDMPELRNILAPAQ